MSRDEEEREGEFLSLRFCLCESLPPTLVFTPIDETGFFLFHAQYKHRLFPPAPHPTPPPHVGKRRGNLTPPLLPHDSSLFNTPVPEKLKLSDY